MRESTVIPVNSAFGTVPAAVTATIKQPRQVRWFTFTDLVLTAQELAAAEARGRDRLQAV